VVGSAAPAEHIELREPGAQRRVAGAEVGGIALVELGRPVELGMALGGRVGAQAANAVLPRLTRREEALEVRGVGAVDHVSAVLHQAPFLAEREPNPPVC